MAGGIEDLLADLAAQFPEDAEDLQAATEVFLKQRLSSCDRVAKLTDSQWSRLELPMGIETLIREAVAARQQPSMTKIAKHVQEAPPSASEEWDEDEEELESRPLLAPVGMARQQELHPKHGFDGGLRRRAQGIPSRNPQGEAGLLSHVDLTPPENLEDLWQQLLEDSLSPDKRAALQESWASMGSTHERYMMFLEYSSYLRKPEMTPEEREERRKQLEPLMKEFGVTEDPEADNESVASLLSCSLILVFLFIAGVVYYSFSLQEPHHDVQSL
mmetsp:Transcript_46768/g.111227  ORF Transcript_46768/g.111227 Transcript_46768/m.111227 type:complete len:273 (+) Transcript_46768:117-935(+)